MKIKLIFKTYDTWIGTFDKYDRAYNRCYVFIFFIPWLGLEVSYPKKGYMLLFWKVWPALTGILIWVGWMYLMWRI